MNLEIITTSLHPDIILWSISAKTVIIAEHTVLREKMIESAFERKKETYCELVAACTKTGWKSCILHVYRG